MGYYERNQFAIGTTISFFILIIFILLAELNPVLLHTLSIEDGIIENLTAILFGLSSICFIVISYRSEFLKEKAGLKYFMVLSWALLMFVFMGEEISWGQRIFDISTPDYLKEINVQDETNLHNLDFMDKYVGGKYRYLSIMTLTIGLVLPVFVLSNLGKSTIQKFAFPVPPLCYSLLFVGGYVYGKYYYPILDYPNDASEVKEVLLSIGIFIFALTGAISPCTLFRNCKPKAR